MERFQIIGFDLWDDLSADATSRDLEWTSHDIPIQAPKARERVGTAKGRPQEEGRQGLPRLCGVC